MGCAERNSALWRDWETHKAIKKAPGRIRIRAGGLREIMSDSGCLPEQPAQEAKCCAGYRAGYRANYRDVAAYRCACRRTRSRSLEGL